MQKLGSAMEHSEGKERKFPMLKASRQIVVLRRTQEKKRRVDFASKPGAEEKEGKGEHRKVEG